jgi:hypothetical protein
MAVFIDRCLTRSIDRAAAAGAIEAIIIVKEGEDPASSMDGALLRRVIDGAIQRADDSLLALRYIPRANAAIITASRKLIEEILGDENIAVASAVDIDLMVFF